MDNFIVIFDPAAHLDQPSAHNDAPLLLHQIRPHHHIDNARFILQSDEAHALGAARPLADQNRPCDMHHGAIFALAQIAGPDKAALSQRRSQKAQRMRFQTQSHGLVIAHHFFRQRHMRQLRRCPLRPLIARISMGKKRQIGRCNQAARIPQGLPARQANRTKAISIGEPLYMMRRHTPAFLQLAHIFKRAPFAFGNQLGCDRFGQAIHLPKPKAKGHLS